MSILDESRKGSPNGDQSELIFNEPLWDDPQLAKALDVQPQTPAAWRNRNQGPPYLKIGKLVRYRPSLVKEWLETRVVRPTEAAR
jgi:predicted DNA-binding transcriptional regulator AlpA